MSKYNVSSFDATELNQAIDDTNFPSSRSSSVSSQRYSNGNENEAGSISASTSPAIVSNSILNRSHPIPLRSFSDDVFDIPGTPRTPRTITTPGIILILCVFLAVLMGWWSKLNQICSIRISSIQSHSKHVDQLKDFSRALKIKISLILEP